MRQVSAVREQRVDCGTSDSITVDEALRRIRQRAEAATPTEIVSLDDAEGRFLAADIVSSVNVPPNDCAAMDGYAVLHSELPLGGETRMLVDGRVAAGHPRRDAAAPGSAVRIFTGAPMPLGLDTVVMQEACIREGPFVHIRPGSTAGVHVRRAGEDVRAGEIVLERGQRLGPQHLALAAATGSREVTVRRRLRVAVFSSGDELRNPGQPLSHGEIYDANRFALTGALRHLGCEIADLGILADDAITMRTALANAALSNDLVLTSGAMSDGEEDHVKSVVRGLGALSFWSLAIKPGRPIGVGQIGTTPFIGLPGNPVAAMVGFFVLARPFVLGLSGAKDIEPRTFPVSSNFRHSKRAGRREYLCACLGRDKEGRLVAQKLARQGSHLLSSLALGDGLVALHDDQTIVEAGDLVDFLPLAC